MHELRCAISSKEQENSQMRTPLERLEFTHREPIFYFKAPVPVMLPNAPAASRLQLSASPP